MKIIIQIAIGTFVGYMAADWIGFYILRNFVL